MVQVAFLEDAQFFSGGFSWHQDEQRNAYSVFVMKVFSSNRKMMLMDLASQRIFPTRLHSPNDAD